MSQSRLARATLVALALALTPAAGALACGGSASQGALARTAGAASLKLVATDPVTVRGAGFARRERVRVTVTTNGDVHVRRVRAGRHGAFKVAFPSAHVGRCGTIGARATGRSGHRAHLRRPMLPACIAQ